MFLCAVLTTLLRANEGTWYFWCSRKHNFYVSIWWKSQSQQSNNLHAQLQMNVRAICTAIFHVNMGQLVVGIGMRR